MPPALPSNPKQLLESITFSYKEFVDRLQAKLKSGMLTEEQKIKVYFFIKAEEVKNMTRGDLHRAKKRYEHTLEAIDMTIASVRKQLEGKALFTSKKRLAERLRLERAARKHCRKLLLNIGEQLKSRA